MKQSDNLTIPEISRLINKTTNTCYRYVREKKLNVITVKQHGKNIVTVTKEELERFCKDNDIIMKQHDNDVITDSNNVITGGNSVTTQDIQDIVKSSIKDSIDSVIFQLTKPIEEQAIFKLGQASQEIVSLRGEKETLLKEIDRLNEQVKQVEQEKKDIINECKRQMEEYINKPFWKKLW